jgi:glycosyltransferase involved in cell wall biosynthesis
MADSTSHDSTSSRILFVAVDGFAVVRFRSKLIETLVGRGARVMVASAALDPGHECALERLGAEVRSFPLERTGLNPLADKKTKDALRRLIREFRPDVVIARAAKPVAYALPIAKELGVPRRIGFMTGLGTMFYPTSRFERMTALLGRRVITRGLRSATEIWVLNPDNATKLHTPSFGLQDVPILDMDSDGVDLDAFTPSPLPPTPTFCFVGRLLPAKGARAFLDAARALQGTDTSMRFIVAGEADMHRAAISEDEVRELARSGAIEYRGFVDDLAALLEECTTLVLPSHHEGRSRSVLEALACGRSIIVSDAAGCRDIITDGREGFVVPLGDHESLCRAIRRIGSDSDLAENCSQAARALAEERYCEQDAANRYADRILTPVS